MSEAPVRFLERDGWTVAYRRTGDGPPIVVLHATLSSSAQLGSLLDRLATAHTVVAVDRRGSGETRPPDGLAPGPIDVAVHVADLVAILAAEGLGPVIAAGHSYGGCLALEVAARRADLVAGAWVYEPPYAPVGPPAVRAALVEIGRRTAAAGSTGKAGDAAETFLAAVGGTEAVERLSPGARQRIRLTDRSALADAALLGLDPDGLARIRCRVVVATGTASEPAYAAIAGALVERVPGAVLLSMDGAGHGGPISQPQVVAAAIAAFAAAVASDRTGDPQAADAECQR